MRPLPLTPLSLAAVLATACASCSESTSERVETPGTFTKAAPIEGRPFSDTGAMPTLQPPESLAADDPGMAAYLNSTLAAGLREDPGQTASGTIEGLITYSDLSLVGVDIDQLLDYVYKPETERAKRFKFPQRILDKAGKDKVVIGFMKALEITPRRGGLKSFMLVRDLQSCCFGGVPRPDECVVVEMEAGKTTEHFMYVPVAVRGTFKAGRLEDEYGYTTAIYTLEASSVELYTPPVTLPATK